MYYYNASEMIGYLMAGLLVAALLALIPAKIASDKGYSFGLWWFYGWMIFIVALIHSVCLRDKYAEEQMYYANRQTHSPEELLQLKQLYDEGVITEQEFLSAKAKILREM